MERGTLPPPRAGIGAASVGGPFPTTTQMADFCTIHLSVLCFALFTCSISESNSHSSRNITRSPQSANSAKVSASSYLKGQACAAPIWTHTHTNYTTALVDSEGLPKWKRPLSSVATSEVHTNKPCKLSPSLGAGGGGAEVLAV